MTDPNHLSDSALLQQADELLDNLQALQTELAAERDALSSRDADALANSNARKLGLIERIDVSCRALPAPLGELILQAPVEGRQKLEAVHKSIIELAAQTQEYNLVNGRIIARSQQSNRELLVSLTGQGAQDTYGATGQPERKAPGNAIARA